ncbi:MAG: hypothetical protein IJ187_10165 [Neisseriaceae bacterium]|nr:hypothetical protein [Neisseriaceae bacterium]
MLFITQLFGSRRVGFQATTTPLGVACMFSGCLKAFYSPYLGDCHPLNFVQGSQ